MKQEPGGGRGQGGILALDLHITCVIDCGSRSEPEDPLVSTGVGGLQRCGSAPSLPEANRRGCILICFLSSLFLAFRFCCDTFHRLLVSF